MMAPRNMFYVCLACDEDDSYQTTQDQDESNFFVAKLMLLYKLKKKNKMNILNNLTTWIKFIS